MILAEIYRTILHAPLGAKPLGFREYFAISEPNLEGERLGVALPRSREYFPIYRDFSRNLFALSNRHPGHKSAAFLGVFRSFRAQLGR